LTQLPFSTKKPDAPNKPAAKKQPIAPKQPRKLAVSGKNAAVGAAAGALIGFFLIAFGLPELVPFLWAPRLVLLGLFGGAVVGSLRGQWILLGANGLLAAAYFVIGYIPIMSGLAPRWVRADPVPATADAIVVLSGSVLSDTALNIDGTERLLSGLELFQRGVASRVITTQVQVQFADGVRSSTLDQGRLIGLAGATKGWIVLEGTNSTRDEALQAAVKLPGAARRIVVVTSPLHTRRACATFEGIGFTVSCYPARTRGRATWHPIKPSDRIVAFADYIYERLGMIKYRWKHWVAPSA
jgi:uncharacterized SAM-binding protein YcdF (DUF218 family)